MNQVQGSKKKNEASSTSDASGEYANVGALLRAAREQKNRSIDKLAGQLNIKVEYLHAMENGDFDQLPGTTYTTGFLRTYAEALGLNGADVIGLYKEHNPEPDPVQTMHFVSPLQQSGIPKGAVVFVGLMLAIFGYGVWYFAGTGEDTPERIASVPEHLKAKVNDTADAKGKKGPDTAAKENQPAAVKNVAQAKPAAKTKTKAKAKTVAAAGTEQKPAADGLAQQTATAPPTRAGRDEQEQGGQRQQQTATDAADNPQAAQDQPAAPVREGNRVNVPDGSRVVLRAVDESWVRVWDSSTQQVLFSGLLKAGQSYYAPDRKGLTMETGNAGGLEIVVDGKPLPPLGKDGVVKRNVALDAEGLKSQAASLND